MTTGEKLFVLVPVEPTPDMRIAGGIAWSDALPDAETYVDTADACYKAMLAAAPSASASEEAVVLANEIDGCTIDLWWSTQAGSVDRKQFTVAKRRLIVEALRSFPAPHRDVHEECARIAETFHYWIGSADCADIQTKQWIAAAIRSASKGSGR